MADYSGWDKLYRQYPLEELGWELGKPRPILIEYAERGLIPKGKALDLCCGAGTNTVYLAQSGLEVAGTDISKTALEIAEKKAHKAKVNINLLNASFIDLPFNDEEFNFVFDMGCFHHVEVEKRTKFIAGIHQVLKEGGTYMLTCFSYKNGAGWNHFNRQQIIDLFSGHFELGTLRHYPSMEGDGSIRYFYTVLMKKKSFI